MLFLYFWHSTWTCLFTVLFVSYRQNYTRTWFIFISAYKCYRFNYHHLSRALHSRIIFYTDAHSHEKSRTSFKRRKTTKERKASVLISLFGAICLICGYALAANPLYFMSLGDIIGILYAVSSIFVIPSLIAAGTYFSFHKLVFTYSYFKTRRKFYMKRINMLWISDQHHVFGQTLTCSLL